MRPLYLLGFIPFIGILVGAFFANHIHPYVLGLPFFMFWVVMWVVLSAVIMAVIYLLDPSNRGEEDGL